MEPARTDYDFIVIGSGFGGAVSALRLTEKGYKVLVLEQGKRLNAEDFPRTNWNLPRWLWLPFLRFFGLFKLTFFRHVTVLSGTGVGGGSLVYASTHPVPKEPFFKSPSWAHLADWATELKPFYSMALRMLGVSTNPRLERSDLALQELARKQGLAQHFEPTDVAIYFGESGKTVPDPYFGGEGPTRTGCKFCGGCMTGCRHNAKNTLDRNYLYLAEKRGCVIQAESKVYDVIPLDGKTGSSGYRVKWKSSTRFFRKGEVSARGVVFAGGVLGTVELLLKLKESSLPNLSPMVGARVRTNSEAIIPVTSLDRQADYSEGVAIGSILHTDEHSHLEPVRYSPGNGFWRLLLIPMVDGGNFFQRLVALVKDFVSHPVQNLRVMMVDDWSKRTSIMLYMQTLESTLSFRRGFFGMRSSLDDGAAPSPFIPEGVRVIREYARLIGGKPFAMILETVMGVPSTAHILGGAVMGRTAEEGVIDKDNRVFGYERMYVCDGSMISANLGVNPSLTITALAERAMSRVPKAGTEA